MADVTQLLAVLGYEQVSIVGSSLGGWTGYHVAAQSPQLVKKLVVVDVSPEIMTAGRARVRAFSKKENRSVSFEDVLAAQLALFRGDSGRFVRASVERNIMLMPDGTVSWRFDGEASQRVALGAAILKANGGCSNASPPRPCWYGALNPRS
jgi:pimeloyl-ACP methyl ester carboxylesterase